MQLTNAYNKGFAAAIKAMRETLKAVDHVQGDPSVVRQLRREMRSRSRAG